MMTLKAKISLFCDIDKEAIVDAVDVKHLYEVPLNLQQEGLDSMVMYKLGLKYRASDIDSWEKLVKMIKNLDKKVSIGIVGKYTNLKDAYISIVESLNHGGYYHKRNVELSWINSEDLIDQGNCKEKLNNIDGMLVPGGFGIRGIDGKVNAIKFAREKGIPFFGICLGMQCAVIEFSRNILEIKGANSSEFDPETKDPVIDLMIEQKKVDNIGGTMRLGKYPCLLKSGTLASKAYGEELISERHRHRYELNNDYIQRLEENGMMISGIYPDKNLAEIIELKDHPWFIGVQFHPEFKSRPDKPHPLFRDFIGAAIKNSKNNNK